MQRCSQRRHSTIIKGKNLDRNASDGIFLSRMFQGSWRVWVRPDCNDAAGVYGCGRIVTMQLECMVSTRLFQGGPADKLKCFQGFSC